ncbi:4-hydroxy-2-oxoglutarate aldolase, mitochondrial [Armadillidium nasatum]|uniref:4-hydroxy-2-oxoglutarate aldolase, mitochondrial n=1 Tax=Armadillidium nasatum TaxID=96803 RepID=A0A5N5SJC3_9CRUS|nr:4-hydroxy-2-oxoglutarate aldolase, mitochondrial [Armadillidium nasatum]
MSVDERRKHGLSLNGILPPITTPFNEDESIAWDKLEANFKKWNNFPFRGYVVEGSTGEYIYLTTEEKIELIRKSRQSIGKDKILIAGSATKGTIYLSKKMAEAGADAVMVVTPNYFKADMKV